jgi:hypothetical protein
MANLWSILRGKSEERYGLGQLSLEKALFNGQTYGLYGGYGNTNSKYESLEDNFCEYGRPVHGVFGDPVRHAGPRQKDGATGRP